MSLLYKYLLTTYITCIISLYSASDVFSQIVKQSIPDKVVVLTIHSVPDGAHPWVNTPPELFEAYLQYLHDHQYTVTALRDLDQYVDADKAIKMIEPEF